MNSWLKLERDRIIRDRQDTCERTSKYRNGHQRHALKDG